MHSVLYEKTKFDRLYTILQKNGGTDTKAMGQTEKKFSPTLRNIYKKQHVARPCTPKNWDVPPTMKVKGCMYPQMKKPVGMLIIYEILPALDLTQSPSMPKYPSECTGGVKFKIYRIPLIGLETRLG